MFCPLPSLGNTETRLVFSLYKCFFVQVCVSSHPLSAGPSVLPPEPLSADEVHLPSLRETTISVDPGAVLFPLVQLLKYKENNLKRMILTLGFTEDWTVIVRKHLVLELSTHVSELDHRSRL